MKSETVESSNDLPASCSAQQWVIRWDFQQKECLGGVFADFGVGSGGIGFSLGEAW